MGWAVLPDGGQSYDDISTHSYDIHSHLTRLWSHFSPHYHKVMVTLFTPQSQGYGHTFLAQTHNSYKEVMVTLHGNANTVHSRYDSCYGTGDWHKNSNQ